MKNDNNVFGHYNDKDLDKAYQLYAILYYDLCDSNLEHFFNRNKDIQPIVDCKTDDEKKKGYARAIKDLFNHALSMGESKNDLIRTYPDLVNFI